MRFDQSVTSKILVIAGCVLVLVALGCFVAGLIYSVPSPGVAACDDWLLPKGIMNTSVALFVIGIVMIVLGSFSQDPIRSLMPLTFIVSGSAVIFATLLRFVVGLCMTLGPTDYDSLPIELISTSVILFVIGLILVFVGAIVRGHPS